MTKDNTKANWQTRRLGDVCDFQNGFAFKSKLFEETGFPILRISNIQNNGISYNRLVFFDKKSYKEDFDKYKAQKGDLVIAMSGATTGKLAICDANEMFYLNQRVGKFEPKKNLLKDYLYYFLSTRIEENLKISTGSAQPNLSTEQIKNFEIPLPLLPEQHRIVKILDEVFVNVAKAKENTEKNLQNAKDLFESYSQGIFANLGKDWERKRLSDVFIIKPPKKEAQEKLKKDDFVSFVPMENLGIGEKELNLEKERKLKDVVGGYTYFANEDVLLAKITPCFENGKLGIARNLKNGIGFGSSEYIVFRSNGKVIPDYLYYFLARDEFRKKGAQRMSGAVGHKRVSKEFIEESIFSFPKSLVEQESIVKKLDALSAETKKLEAIYKQKLADLEELKKSVLKKAFSGELCLQPDPVVETKNSVISPYKLNQVHAAIIEQVAKDGGQTTEVAVAKYDHLLQEIFGLNLGYQFQTQQFGPFDAKIKKLIYSGLGRNGWFTKKSGMIVFGNNISALLSRQSNLYRSSQSAMKELSRLKVTKLEAEKVELLSTICHSIKETKSIVLDKIREFMSQWPTDGNRTKADKFSSGQTQKCLDFIVNNNLHLKLL